jgi:hypothetical protein
MALNVMITLDHGIWQLPRPKVIISGVAAALLSEKPAFTPAPKHQYVRATASMLLDVAIAIADALYPLQDPSGLPRSNWIIGGWQLPALPALARAPLGTALF